MSQEQQQKELNKVLTIYLENVHILSERNEDLELETKMGGIKKSITRINYDNVIKKLKSMGFISSESKYLLRIQTSTGGGEGMFGNIRTEVEGLYNIRRYCQSNTINIERVDGSSVSGISFIKKQPYLLGSNENVKSIDYPDFDFRISLMNEKKVEKDSAIVLENILKEEKWKQTKKVFRYTNRHTFTHPDPNFPFVVDVSIVKSSKRHSNGRSLVAEYTIQDAGVFKAPESYEIEIECVNANIGIGTPYNTIEKLNTELKKMIKNVLAGFQETNFPISFSEQEEVKQKYMRLFMEDGGLNNHPGEIIDISPKNFAGPSSVTLQIENLVEEKESAESAFEAPKDLIPNILQGYTVTDKADGDRKLLFINEKGKIYLINTNLQVQFTGAMTKKSELFNTLLDGEHILHDKHRRFINRYAAFDIYFIGGNDVRKREFTETLFTSRIKENQIYRLDFLEEVIETLGAVSFVDKTSVSPLIIVKKEFYINNSADAKDSIFKKCGIILSKIKDGLFDYETDGLIFTPGYLGVNETPGKEYTFGSRPNKITWPYSLKWKPVEQNTIDFLVTTKKDTNGLDDIKYISSNGMDTSNTLQVNQYKTLVLKVGYDTEKHSNPYQDMINGRIAEEKYYDSSISNSRKGKGGEYIPVQFFPTDPYDQYAGICNISLREGSGDEKLLLTEANEVFEDNMIVEFRYDKQREKEWRWVPLRVRYDKTAELRTGTKNFGNAYHVANNVWNTIHNPIPAEMIATGENIPENLGDDDVYYNKVSGVAKTRALRDFHNLYVKTLLLKNISRPDDILIDLAVGKAGDLPKWIKAKLKFVFGIDIARDNIQNQLDGACKRYLNYRQKTRDMPSSLFVNGDSSKNIRSGEAFSTEKDKQITKAVFGQGPKNENDLGRGVYKEYGIGLEGFDVCSIQFAIHYMFKDQVTLHSFLRNVSETTRLGGYFVGTSYDGKIMFDKLKNIKENESITILEDGQKIWEVVKKYNQIEFPDDDSCTGYAIDVYQDSINKYFIEYLVNYAYLTRIIENYGFVLLKREEYMVLNMPGSTGLFKDLYDSMLDDIKRDGRKERDYGDAKRMTAGERTISFLNRYFIYKKVRNVDALKEMERNLGIGQGEQAQAEQAQAEQAQAPVQEQKQAQQVQEQKQAPVLEEVVLVEEAPAPLKKTKGKKLGKKLVIE
jgi:hypothetical protein